MTNIEDKILSGKNAGYCSSSEDEADGDDGGGNHGNLGHGPASDQFSRLESKTWVGSSVNTGPKGVIEDWRRYKQLQNEKREAQASELLNLTKKLSMACRTHIDEERAKEKEADEELLKEIFSDDDFIKEYMKNRMKELQLNLKNSGNKFGVVYELTDSEAFLNAAEEESKLYTIIIHLYENNLEACQALNGCFACLAEKYPCHKFCRIRASLLGASNKFLKNALPTIQVYRENQLIGNFVRLADEFGSDFYSDEVESFLKQYGILPDEYTPI